MRKVSGSEFVKKTAQMTDARISRRVCLAGAAAVGAGALGLAVVPAYAQSKQKQTDVAYQTSPKDGNQCDKCAMFVAPDGCQGVEGKISPSGWCDLFSPKA